MSSRLLLPSFSFLKPNTVDLAGRPYPLGATWDGRASTSRCSPPMRQGRALPVRDDRAKRDRSRRAAGTHRGGLARLSAGRAARPALRLPRARALRPGGRPPFQSAQAPDRSLHQAARRPVRWTDAHLGYRVGNRREDLSFDRRDNARAMLKSGWSIRPTPGATTGGRRCRGRTPSSTRRTSKA